jgi:inhibitor of KinA
VDTYRLVELGDTGVLVELGTTIDEALNATALAVAERIRQRGLPGVRDIVPAYASLAVHVDPAQTDLPAVLDTIHSILTGMPASVHPRADERTIEVPVCYDPAFGPDLSAVAERALCSVEEVAAMHAARQYRVFMLGFLPGFAYMGNVHDRIAMPRHDTPRARVTAGSVGIAGRQTGVYPRDTPGGWQIIGRTPLRLFDVHRDPPALLAPGASVRFVPITRADFDERAAREARA